MNAELVIMAGGSGTRFWPKSTSKKPKQLLSFGGGGTLLRQTLDRFDGIVARDRRTIVTTQVLGSAVRAEAPECRVLEEPQARNTAPCVYWAAREVAQRDPRAVMLVMPADHFIPRLADYQKTVREAVEWAASHDDLVTLGIKPSRPETGYGYLKLGAQVGGAHQVEAFVEKPDLKRAEEFLRAGNYQWNGGMFVWRAEVILRAFDEFMPEMKRAWESSQGEVSRAYPQMTATSIDFGVMEKARNVVSFTLDCGWDDLGSWPSLEGVADFLRARHEAGVVTGGDVVAVESSGNIVDAHGKLVALLGVDDLIIVDTGPSLLVARKDRAQDIRRIVEGVKVRRPELA
jgi:mannose-1-phosphate guanylyltransferase